MSKDFNYKIPFFKDGEEGEKPVRIKRIFNWAMREFDSLNKDTLKVQEKYNEFRAQADEKY